MGLSSLKGRALGISPFSERKRLVAKTGFLIFLVSHAMVLLINRGYRKRSKHVTLKNNLKFFTQARTKFFLEISCQMKQKLIKVNFLEKLPKTKRQYISQVEGDLSERCQFDYRRCVYLTSI